MYSETQEIKLSNGKVFLDEFKPEDFDEIKKTISKSDDCCYFGDFFDKSELLEKLSSRSILSNSDPLNMLWSIRSKRDNSVVGVTGFQPDPVHSEKTQLIWFVCLDMVTKKHAATVVHMLMEYAFEYHDASSLSVFVPTGQKKHKSVARQIGLKFQKFLWKDDQSLDYYLLYS